MAADEAKPKPVPTDEKTSSDDIKDAPRPRRGQRPIEDRIAFLEDENSNLRDSNKSLEKQLSDIAGSLKSKPGSGGKSLWQELEDFFNW